MTTACIYLIRHAHVLTPRPRRFLGQTDIALSKQGQRQALALRPLFADLSFDSLFSSPLLRARQTAQLATGRSAQDIRVVEQFKEIDLGEWEGLTVEEVRQKYPGQYERRGLDFKNFRPLNGESFADVQQRVVEAFEHICTICPGKTLIVAHAGVNRTLLAHLLPSPLEDILTIPQDYCGINILDMSMHRPIVQAINTHSFPSSAP